MYLMGMVTAGESGRAVEAAGNVDALLLDKTGTITFGNRRASDVRPLPGVERGELLDAAHASSLADQTPEGRSIVEFALADRPTGASGVHELSEDALIRAGASFVPFTAQTRSSLSG